MQALAGNEQQEDVLGVSSQDEPNKEWQLFVVGDTHGDHDYMVRCLLATLLFQLVHKGGERVLEWNPLIFEARDGIMRLRSDYPYQSFKVVILGDAIDRGTSGMKILKLIRKLESHPVVGDRLKFLLGNHEQMMLRHVGQEDFAEGDKEFSAKERYALLVAEDGEKSEMITWLRTHDVVFKWNGVLMMHGGLSKVVAQMVALKLKKDCPLPSMRIGGKNCAKGADCINDINGTDVGYYSVADAWERCGSMEECGGIAHRSNGKFYLRRSDDPDRENKHGEWYSYCSKEPEVSEGETDTIAKALQEETYMPVEDKMLEYINQKARAFYLELHQCWVRETDNMKDCLERARRKSDSKDSQKASDKCTKACDLKRPFVVASQSENQVHWTESKGDWSGGGVLWFRGFSDLSHHADTPASCDEAAEVGHMVGTDVMVLAHTTHRTIKQFCGGRVFVTDTHPGSCASGDHSECDFDDKAVRHAADYISKDLKYVPQALKIVGKADGSRTSKRCLFKTGQYVKCFEFD